MKKKFSFSTVLALMLLVAAVTFTLTYTEVRNSVNLQLNKDAEQQQAMSKYLEVKRYIDEYYVGDYDEDKLLDSSLQGLISGLSDKWSYYMNAKEYKAYLQASENKYVGIGVTASYDENRQAILITEVLEGSPAKEAGLKALEIITAINGKPVSELGYLNAISDIKGEENTKVKLEITGDQGEKRTVDITRKTVEQEPIHSQILEGNIGYVRISNFESGASADFEQSVQKLVKAGVTGIVFDVRLNPGGKLQELIPMLNKLLPEGRIFTSRDKDGKEETYDSDASEVDLPMAVITNQYSYSAAEFFAAALQEYGKASIVGTATTGKGYAQIPIELKDGSAIVLSVTEYFTPKGKSLAGVGLKPDFEVKISDEQLSKFPSIPIEEDGQLKKAIEVVNLAAQQMAGQEKKAG